MKPNPIILQGGGEHARVVLDSLLDQRFDVVGIFDPKYKGDLFGVPQLGTYQPDKFPDASMIIAIGDNGVRKKVAGFSKHAIRSIVDKTSIVSSRAKIGEGSMILHGSIVQAQTVIGKHVIVNTGAQIDHDCLIDDFVHVGPGAILCGTVAVGEGAFIGAGSVIIPGVRIGEWSVIGAGAVVVHDIPPNSVAFGNPARVIKKLPA